MFPHDFAVQPPRSMSACRAFASERLPDVDGRVWLELVGDLDLVTAAEARDAVRGAQVTGRPLVCDLRKVRFVDLAGLRVLVDATAHARLTGSRLTLVNCPSIVPRMLELLGISDELDIEVTPRRGTRRSRRP